MSYTGRSPGVGRALPVVRKLKSPLPIVSPVVLYDVLSGVLVVVESYRGCKMSVPVPVPVWMDGSMSRRLGGTVFEIS